MKDPSDRYVGLLIKSWAAEQYPPQDGRKQLLNGVLTTGVTHPPVRPFSIFRKIWALFTRQSMTPWIFGDKWFGPYTQTKAWSFHLATDLRLLT